MNDVETPAPKWTPPEPRKLPIAEQIAEVKFELAMRKRNYPGFIERGKIDGPAEADQHWSRMQAALQTLLWVEKNRERLVGLDQPLGMADPAPGA